MSNLVVRGYGESGSFVTRGYGPQEGNLFTKALAGIITMAGTLSALFIDGGDDDAVKNQGGIRIDIDIGI